MTDTEDAVSARKGTRRVSRLALAGLYLSIAPAALIVGMLFGVPFPFRDIRNHISVALCGSGFAAVAAAYAVVALVTTQRSRRMPEGKAAAKAALTIGLLSGIALFVLPAFEAAWWDSQGCKCGWHMRDIARALDAYKADFGDMPPAFQTLVDKGYVKDMNIFRCPESPRGKHLDPHDVDATGDYYYARLRNGTKAAREVPIAWERAEHYMSRCAHAIRADGLTLPISRVEHRALIAANALSYEHPPVLPVEADDNCWIKRLTEKRLLPGR